MDDRTARGQRTFAYEVRVSGRLSRALRAEFEDLGLVARDRPVETVLCGPVVDQAALYGLLRRIEALGLELVEVRRVPGETAGPPVETAEPPPGDAAGPPGETAEPPPGDAAAPRGARQTR